MFGAIWLTVAVMVVFTYLQGKVSSGDVPESPAEVLFWSALVGPYFNALALPLTLPVAGFVGFGWACLKKLHVRRARTTPQRPDRRSRSRPR